MTTGVLAMTYGTPASASDLERFYTDIRGGRRPTPEQLSSLRARYEAIGGISPLNVRTADQIHALGEALEHRAPHRYLVASASKHAPPQIEPAVKELAGLGVERIIGLVLAPHYAQMSIGEYARRLTSSAESVGVRHSMLERWGSEPVLIDLLADRVADELARASSPGRSVVIFTAHSLPTKNMISGDGYPSEVAETAALIASKLELRAYEVAWQSAPRTPEPWLEPTLAHVLDRAAADGAQSVVVCPVGFTSDHLEVLYDLDVEAAAHCRAAGLEFHRTASLNAEPRLFDALARRVIAIAEDDGRAATTP